LKGTDCTPEQIAAASQFLTERGWPDTHLRAALDRFDAVRLIAWYGALRFKSAKNGTGTLERPAPLVEIIPAAPLSLVKP
jgi:hypothetical protein